MILFDHKLRREMLLILKEITGVYGWWGFRRKYLESQKELFPNSVDVKQINRVSPPLRMVHDDDARFVTH
jgi:hypothetical protein